ncbi:Isoleucine--tRNA ligase [compost metagenome]
MNRDFAVTDYEEIIKEEINVKVIDIETSDSGFVNFLLKLNLKVAGKKYGKNVGFLQGHLKGLSADEARQVVENGQIKVTSPEGEELLVTSEELLVEKQAKPGFASASGYGITVALNTDISPELEQEGWVREVVRAVQDTRKKLDLPIEKRVHLTLDVDDELRAAITAYENVLRENVLITDVSFGKPQGDIEVIDLGSKQIGVHID